MAVMVLLLMSFWLSIESTELVGNYKFWSSVSDSIIYDHSGLTNHGAYSTRNFYFTDRGIMIYNSLISTIPSSNIKEYPGYTDFMVSYWYLRKNSRLSACFRVVYANSREIVIFLKPSTTSTPFSTNIKLEIFNPWSSLSDSNYSTPDLINKWRLYTFKVTQNLSNTESTITIYIDLQLITSFVMTQVSLNSQSHIRFSADTNYLYGIIYEMWWHKDVSDINELDYLINSSSTCSCSYGCVTSPTNICLPIYDSTFNYQGDGCSPRCPRSCDTNFECINSSKSECKYGLYDLKSGNCLFYCPDESCILSASLELTCKIGYKKVSDNPPACIPLQCTSYERIDYKYMCHGCEVGYIPDYLRESCICDDEFTAVSLDPPICVKIEKCLAYEKSDTKYVCSSCIEGYSIDSEGNCNECDSNYIQVLDDPFTCIPRIEHCNHYEMLENRWICKACELGYMTISDEVCNEDIEVCESSNILSDGSCGYCPETCEGCNIFDDKIECSGCKKGYTQIEIEDEISCILCSSDNPICKLEINTNSETDSGSDENHSGTQENTEQGTGEENDSSYEVKEESNNLSESMIVSQSHVITQTLGLASAAVSIISMNPSSFFAMLGTTQILGFILLYNLDITDRVRTVIEGVKILQIIPNAFEYFIPNIKTLYEMRYDRAGYSSEYILLNSGKFIFISLSILLSCAIIKLISKILNRNHKLQQHLNRMIYILKMNLLMYIVQMHLEVTISSFINLVNFSYRDAYSGINLAVSLIISLASFYAPIKCFLYTIKHHNEIQNDVSKSEFQALYSNLKKSDINFLILSTILLIRNLIYAINMVFLHSSSYIQVILNSSASLSVLTYQLIHKPYILKRDNYINIFVEGCIFTTLSLLGFITSPNTFKDLYDVIEWSMILTIYSSIAIPLGINIIITIMKLIMKCKPKSDTVSAHNKTSIFQ